MDSSSDLIQKNPHICLENFTSDPLKFSSNLSYTHKVPGFTDSPFIIYFLENKPFAAYSFKKPNGFFYIHIFL